MKQNTSDSKIVNWGGYLAISLLILLVLSIFIVRAGMWQQGLALYALCSVGAAITLGVFALCLVLPGFAALRRPLLMRSLLLLPGTLLFLGILTGGKYPQIHDITTDVADPPVFAMAGEIRDKSANSLELDPQTIQQQLSAYPDIQTVHSNLDFAQAYAQAEKVAANLGWEITRANRLSGEIEAVDTTKIMAFKDDIVIRVRRAEDGSVVDLRSASRVGKSDMGANSKRIRSFMAQFKLP
ncbi:MAG: hypothetical protein ACI8QT_000545 [Halioglobus sp.]|jgi:uncharacterized protein (DUF1499 family)